MFILLLFRVFTVLVFMSGLGMSKIYQPIDKSISLGEKYYYFSIISISLSGDWYFPVIDSSAITG